MAKQFRFRLQTLLRVRDVREREAKRNVATKRAAIARLAALNQQNAEEILRREGDVRARLAGGALDPAAITRERAFIAHLRRQILERQALRLGLERELAAALDAWRHARMQLRALEKLRERRFEEHRRTQALREQADADEVARNLYAYGREGLRAVP